MAANVHLRKKAVIPFRRFGHVPARYAGGDPGRGVRIGFSLVSCADRQRWRGTCPPITWTYYDHLKSVPTDAALSVAQMKGDTALKEKRRASFRKTLAGAAGGHGCTCAGEGGRLAACQRSRRCGRLADAAGRALRYVKANAVVQATTALALEWMLPQTDGATRVWKP